MAGKVIRIAYLSANDPRDVHVWSGVHYSIYKALLASGAEVEILGPYRNSLVDFRLKMRKAFYKLFLNKRYNQYHSRLLSKTYGRYFSSKLQGKHFDLVLAVSASAELAHLQTNIPVVFMADALFSSSLNYYSTLSNLCKRSLKEGFETENLALQKAQLLYLPSGWAKQAAMKDFKAPESKILIGPMGANLENIPAADYVLEYKQQKDNSFINLVFVGVNWENKGGPVAYECLLELLKAGHKAKLTIVGCKVPDTIKHEHLHNIPFIKKTTAEGRRAFEELYLNADFHILPTRFEAYGVVFCEASAHGVINIAADTGGTSTPIREGANGFLMPPGSTGADYARKVIEVYSNKEKFRALQVSARKEYDERLSWSVWVSRLFKEVILEKR